ncbi:MAG: hypothetical protein J0653_08390, partial [Deltaproteobacteria bacterium]|nr:hypothetical protein [Deltaproteobacteria bacterium]
YKIIMVNDRTDLEEQLSNTASLTGESVTIIGHRADLNKLVSTTSNLNMVMVHKFLTRSGVSAQSLIDSGIVPQFEPFQSINDSERILLLIDEAHRTQAGDMGDNLFTGPPWIFCILGAPARTRFSTKSCSNRNLKICSATGRRRNVWRFKSVTGR